MRSRIVDALLDHLRTHGQPPESVEAFCRAHGWSEDDFRAHFASLSEAEALYWDNFLRWVVEAVEGGAEWEEFNARQRLLSLLFAFIEAVQDEKALVRARLNSALHPLLRPDYLAPFEARFRAFATRLAERGVVTQEIASRGPLNQFYPGAFALHLHSVLAFHLRDDSAENQRTDAFIEKSTNLLFEILREQAFDAAFDLARFLLVPAAGPSEARSGQQAPAAP
ncbi:MAG: hypothetical protein JSR82_16835 [Verrucomicrobia bacterium]|nr:hypothetical protein [Verrucomicrobiota bacterium]